MLLAVFFNKCFAFTIRKFELLLRKNIHNGENSCIQINQKYVKKNKEEAKFTYV